MNRSHSRILRATGIALTALIGCARHARAGAICAAALSLLAAPATVAVGPCSGGNVLILESMVTGGCNSPEALAAVAAGCTVDLVSSTMWAGMTTAQFASYKAIVIGDPTCVDSIDPVVAATACTWGPAIDGNCILIGTDPTYHFLQGGLQGAQQLIDCGMAYAVAQTCGTGLYLTLSCAYSKWPDNIPVPELDGLCSPCSPPCFAVSGHLSLQDENVHIVPTSPVLTNCGLTDSVLSNWGDSVHEAFTTYPSNFIPLAMNVQPGGPYTAPDGTEGYPYILARGPVCCVPAPPDMVAWWRLDETSGTNAAEVINGNDGTHVGGPSPFVGEYVHNSLHFDGVDDSVYVPANNTDLKLLTSDFTVDAWIRWAGPTSEVNHEIVSQNGYRFRLVFGPGDTSARLLLWLIGGGNQKCLSSVPVVPVGQWVHVACTLAQQGSPIVCKLYVNGALVHTGFPPSVNNNSSNGEARIGASLSALGNFFNGDIDEIEIFNRALEQSEIKAIFDAGTAGKCCMKITDEAILCKISDQDPPGLTGCYQYTFDLTNHSGVTAQYVLLPNASTTPHVIPIGPLPSGATTTVTFQICDQPPGSDFCFDMSLADANVDECCAIEHCVTLPDCTCFQLKEESITLDPGSEECDFQYVFQLTNLTPEFVAHMFLIPPIGGPLPFTITPDYIAFSPVLPPFGVTDPLKVVLSFGPVCPLGGTQWCFLISIHDASGQECCAKQVCITIPDGATPTCPGDIDGDGTVGITDFLALLAAWGPNPGNPADIDGNGTVDITDFLALLAAWGPCP